MRDVAADRGGRGGGSSSWLARPLVIDAGLILLNLFIYGAARHFQLVNWDDSTYLADNPKVLGGLSWSSAWWALTTACHAGIR